jgi:hypothetical protein
LPKGEWSEIILVMEESMEKQQGHLGSPLIAISVKQAQFFEE